MKISVLFDCHTFDMEQQGTSTFLAGLINELPRVLSERWPSIDVQIHCAAQERANVERHIKVFHHFHAIGTGFIARNLYFLPKLSQKLKADFVVSQYVRPLWVHRFSASVIHDLLFLDFPQQFSFSYRNSRAVLFGMAAKFSTLVFTVSEYSQNRISSIFGVNKSKIGLLPNAVKNFDVAIARTKARSAANSTIKLLAVSRLEPRKRHEWSVRLLHELLSEGFDATLTIVGGGGGKYADGLRKTLQLEAQRLPGVIRHLEGISDEQLQTEYANADIFLFTSLGEGFGIPVIEAAAASLPCIVASGTALSELREHYVGYEFNRNEYDSFSAATKLLIKDLEKYQGDAELTAPKVREYFQWNSAALIFAESIIKTMQQEQSR